jgi:hypothetical protein
VSGSRTGRADKHQRRTREEREVSSALLLPCFAACCIKHFRIFCLLDYFILEGPCYMHLCVGLL